MSDQLAVTQSKAVVSPKLTSLAGSLVVFIRAENMLQFTQNSPMVKNRTNSANSSNRDAQESSKDEKEPPAKKKSNKFLEMLDLESIAAVVTIFSGFKDLFGGANEKLKAANTALGKFASALGEAIVSAAKMSIKGAAEESHLKQMLIARSGSEDTGTRIFDMIRSDAAAAGASVQAAETTALEFMPVVQDTDQLRAMTKMAIDLSAFDVTGGGLKGATDAIQKAIGGDVKELTERYNIAPAVAEQLKKGIAEASKSGDMGAAIKSLSAMMEKANMGASASEALSKSPTEQFGTMQQNVQNSFAQAGAGAVAAILPLMTKINEAFQAGKFQPFFDLFGGGLTIVANLLSIVGDAALWLADAFIQNWPTILAILMTVAVALLPMMLASLWSLLAPLWAMIPPLLMQAAAWLMINWPILLIILLVGILIGMFLAFGGTASQIVGAIVGAFYAFFAFIYNGIAFLWNNLVSFAEFFANLFNNPVYAIRKLVYDLLVSIVGQFGSMYDSVRGILNKLIEKFNAFFGANISIIPELDTSLLDKLKPEAGKDVADFSSNKMKFKDVGDEFMKGQDKGKDWTSKIGGGLEDFKTELNGGKAGFATKDEKAKGANIDRVGEVGKINDSVDISSEEIKTMRELAEMKNIQNFVTLQPSISVQTGDINNGYDIDTVIRRMEQSLTNEIASSAEGVYR